MKLLLSKETMVLKHGKLALDFGVFKPKKTNSEDPKIRALSPEAYTKKLSDAMFVELNGYWETLPDEEQDIIFKLYTTIHDDIYDSPSQSERVRWVRKALGVLLDKHHPFAAISEFMEGKEIRSTDNVKEVFDTDLHDSISRQTTYIKSEYRELALLTIIIRAVAPIWNLIGTLSPSQNDRAGSKVYHEIEMFSMLADSKLITCDAFKRLEEFVGASWDKYENGKNKQEAKDSILSSVVAGLGTSDIPNYLLATSVVNKLAIRELNTFRDEGDLITHVYQRIDNEVGKLATKFAKMKPRVATRGGEDEDKTGYLESFRTREVVRRDVHMVTQIYLKNYRKVKKDLDADIPNSLIKECFDSFKEYKPLPIRDDQKVMVQWVLAKLVPARAISHINRDAMLSAMAITQAALIHWRFRNIAMLMSAKPVVSTENSLLITTPFDAVTADLRSRLNEVYPHFRHSKNTTSIRQMCPGLQALEAYTKMFADQMWEFNCDPELEKSFPQLAERGKVFKPARSLKNELAELLVKINR